MKAQASTSTVDLMAEYRALLVTLYGDEYANCITVQQGAYIYIETKPIFEVYHGVIRCISKANVVQRGELLQMIERLKAMVNA